MSELIDNLNYDYNYNMFLAKLALPNLNKMEDRQKVIRWVKRLSLCNSSVEEMKLRNDFMHFLVLNVQHGELQPPFTDNPPTSALPDIADLLPGGVSNVDVEKEFTGDGGVDGQRPLLYENSPDGGAFLAAQPVPRCGAFCYLAVVARPPKE